MVIPAAAHGQSCAASVGFRIATVAGLKTGIWYPATAPEAPYTYSDRATQGSVAANAPVASCARFPLVVFSHGFGGCGIQSVFITETLARSGYIVAAPDHKDAGCSVDGSTGSKTVNVSQEPFNHPETWTDQTYVDRKNDIQNLITAMLSDAEFGPVTDAQHVVGMGHSLGGYTIFGLAGGWPSWKDPRITAAVLLSPYMDPFLLQNDVPGDTIPTMYQGGTLDFGITPSIEKAGGAYDLSTSPKFFAKFPGGHLTWTNSTCDSTISQCLATNSTAQDIDATLTSFFDHYAKGADRSDLFFRSTNATVRVYRRSTIATSVSGASYLPVPLPSLSVGSVFGEGLTERTLSAASPVLTLGGMSALVTDAAGRQQNAQFFLVSPNQANVLMPANLADGTARIDLRNTSDIVATGSLRVSAVAPALFSARADGKGTPAGQYIVVKADGSRTEGFLFTANLAAQSLDLTSGQVYVVLYGTGFRQATASGFAAQIGKTQVPVFAVGPSAQYPGLDQVALGPLPASLAGSGTANLTVSAGGTTSNTLTLLIQ